MEAEQALKQADEAKARVKEYADRIRTMLVSQQETLENDPALQTEETAARREKSRSSADDLYADLPYHSGDENW